MAEPCTQAETIGILKATVEGQSASLNDIKAKVGDVEKRVLSISDNLNSRPTWATSILITVLSSTCVGLIMFIVTNG